MDPSHDWLRPERLYALTCRPALPKDTPDVMELTRDIWEGEDYVPHVWEEWLVDPEGMLAVAEFGGRVVGLSKLTRLNETDWWLEGLRVHPRCEGRGIASRLHDYLLDYWDRSASGTLRLATASYRKSVQHLCDRTGFRWLGEFTSFTAPALPEPADGFSLLQAEQARAAAEFALQSPSLALTAGLMDYGWQWGRPAAQPIAAAAGRSQAWWWQGRSGLLAARRDEDEGETRLAVQLLACRLEDLERLLLDYRRLAASAGYPQAYWLAPLRQELAPALQAAGFERTWDASLYVYEKRHPARG